MLVLDTKAGPIRSIAFAPTGRGFAAIGKKWKGLLLWDDFAGGDPVRLVSFSSVPLAGRVRFTADGRRVGCQNRDTNPVVFDPTRDRVFGPALFSNLTSWGEMTPDGDAVVLAVNHQPWSPTTGSRFRLTCRPVEPSPRNATRWSFDRNEMCLGEFAFPPGGEEFVTLESTTADLTPAGRVRFVRRQLATGELVAASDEFTGDVRGLVAGPGARTAGIRTNQIVVWSEGDVDSVQIWKSTTPRQFGDLALHPSCPILAATDHDPTVRVYDAATGAVVRTYDWQVGKLRCVAFSPDGLLAAAGSESGKIVVWDVDL